MIARTWRGTVRRADADDYAEYIRETGFAEYGQTPGNQGAWMLRRDEGERTELVTLSLWDPRTRSARSPATTSKPPFSIPEDRRYLIGGESTVTHYQVVDHAEPTAGHTSQP